MPHITTIVDPAMFLQAVRSRLARFEGDRCALGRASARCDLAVRSDPGRTRAVEEEKGRVALAAFRAARRAATDPSTLRALSWQHGLSAAQTDEELDRAARAKVELSVQNDEHTYSTREAVLCTFADSIDECEALAQRELDRGRWLHAQAWRSAARWLGGTRSVTDLDFAGRDDPRPERARAQPSPTFRTQPWKQRHWLAWDAKNDGITDLPTLLLASDDESFVVRARAYRSLGQAGHLAATFALREGLRDPHPFARAQAARSLGWLGAAMAVGPLLVRAKRDSDDEVRRAASDALARIIALWEYWGEWPEILASRAKTASVAAKLRLVGAFGAVELPVPDAPRCGKPSVRVAGVRYEYRSYFEDAQREHDAQRNAGNDRSKLGARIDDALARNDTRALAALLAAVSTLGASECDARVAELCEHAESAIAFHAARTRRLRSAQP
ncbi:MAG: HEAT repeat domain-containing protein [Polyangiales bacterium]